MPQEGASSARRDQLLRIQQDAQARWASAKAFEEDAPGGAEGRPAGKFFGTFPYPYMNGRLHVGHAFSLSKLEFAAAFHRLCGKRVLFPQGFHCTGMPIKASADKLRAEVETYGNPPVFPGAVASGDEGDSATVPGSESAGGKAPKSKVAAKTGLEKTQWGLLRSVGVPEEEIPAFQDPLHWLRYFPPIARSDLTAMGCGIDWRRSFITTDVNPYYDSFVRWQFLTLKDQGRVVKDKRFAVYSPKDGQPCADHDRASGEGVGPQEYTLIKMEALDLRGPLAPLSGRGRVLFMAATLRPETMYGQTNCWVLPEGDYGAFQGLDDEIYIMCERAARNLSYQDKTPEAGVLTRLASCKGADLIGTPLRAPRAAREPIYVLPLLTILMSKGTGVVTSVPSDSPTDFIALRDLQRKPRLREKYGVQDEWVLPVDVVPIIHIPGLGDTSAVQVVEDLRIESQNDVAKLETAKDMTYKRGFSDGVMTVGSHAGEKVAVAKPLIRRELLDAGDALVYSEPESRVESRSGDECVVALTDQWYILYGEQEWRATTEKCLNGMEVYDDTVRHAFQHTLGWLNQWACSRSFGLGTRLPWEPEYLIESLSDSTIYMAFYTVAHILQHGDMYGEGDGPVKAEDMTREVWDAIFLGKAVPDGCRVPPAAISRMRDEFTFWYPMDLRVSGKDLIQNHLTFALYNHTAIWPSDRWPRAMRTNGHLLLNGLKMSKQTGNFLTLRQAIDRYSADAVRIALADASDSNDDGNFEESTANAAVLRLTKELAWIEENLAAADGMRGSDSSSSSGVDASRTFADRVFVNAIFSAAAAARAAYERLLFRDALKAAMYDLQSARDLYRVQVGPEGLHRDAVRQYVQVSCKILAPICPHWCDHVFSRLLGSGDSVLRAGWPDLPAPDPVLRSANTFVEKLITDLRSAIAKREAPPKKKKDAPPPAKVTRVELHTSEAFTGWRAAALGALRNAFDAQSGAFSDDWASAAVSAARADPDMSGRNEKAVKSAVMPFAKYKKLEAETSGAQVLDLRLPFSQVEVLHESIPHLQRSVGIEDIVILQEEEHSIDAAASGAEDGPLPGVPKAVLFT